MQSSASKHTCPAILCMQMHVHCCTLALLLHDFSCTCIVTLVLLCSERRLCRSVHRSQACLHSAASLWYVLELYALLGWNWLQGHQSGQKSSIGLCVCAVTHMALALCSARAAFNGYWVRSSLAGAALCMLHNRRHVLHHTVNSTLIRQVQLLTNFVLLAWRNSYN